MLALRPARDVRGVIIVEIGLGLLHGRRKLVLDCWRMTTKGHGAHIGISGYGACTLRVHACKNEVAACLYACSARPVAGTRV